MPQNLKNAQYDVYTAVRQHLHKNGLATMPVAGIFPQRAQVVALHGGLDYDAISYVAGKRGAPPTVPSPQTTNRNRVFLEGGRVGQWATPDMAGVMTYYVAGWLLFGILSPEGLASDFMLGMVPFPGLTLSDQVMPSMFFKYGLINDQQIAPIPPNGPALGFQALPPLINAIAGDG